MEIGIRVLNMGPQSSRETMAACARAVEAAGFESLWLVDHIAVPPDDAAASGGRYMDSLVMLGWLAGITERVKLGTGVLVLPYRAALPTAKQIATVQELSGGRVLLGVGVGWMEAEFRALNLDRRRRGRSTDETLAFLHECFARDEITVNGQPILFGPRPARPPFLIGGQAPHAIERAAKWGDGWFPNDRDLNRIAAALPRYRDLTAAAGKPAGQVTVSLQLPLDDLSQTRSHLARCRDLGIDRVVHRPRYDTAAAFARQIDRLREAVG